MRTLQHIPENGPTIENSTSFFLSHRSANRPLITDEKPATDQDFNENDKN